MKKVFSLLMTFLMVSILLVTNVWATDILIIKGDTVTCNPGDQTVTFDVTIDENPGLGGLTVKLTFDGSVMKCTNIVDGNNIDTLTFSKGKINANDATCSWLNMSDDKVHGGTGVIATFTFSINEDAAFGSHDVKLEITTSDEKFQTVPFEATNGSITVLDNRPEITGLSMTDAEFTYDGTAKTIEVAGALSTDTVTYTTTMGGSAVSGGAKSVGEYIVTATVERDGCKPWTGSAKLTINPKEVTVNVPTVESKPYDGTPATDEIQAALAEATVEGVETGDTVNAIFQNDWSVDAVNADKYSVTIGVGVDNSNYTLKEKTVTLNYEITKKPITVKADSFSKTKGLDLPELTYTVDPEGGLVSADQLVVSLTAENWSKDTEKVDDKYVITGTLGITPETSAKNYDLQLVDGTMTIIDDTLESIKVTAGENFKDTYFVGEPLDVENLTITAHYEKNGDVIVPANQCTITPSEMPNVDADGTEQTITVTYNGKTDSTIEVTVNIDDIVSISVNTTDEWIWVGEEPTVTVTATYESGNTDTLAADAYVVTVANTTEAAEAQVTVTCGTITNTDLKITVIEKALDRLEVVETTDGALSKVAGQTFKVADGGVQIHAVYKDKSGVESKVDVTSEFNTVEITSATAGTVSKPITYTKKVGGYEKEVTCDLTVDFAAKAVSSITATEPTKTEYTEGTKFDPAGMTVTITYNDGDSVTVTENYANYNITFTPATLKLSDNTVTVSCGSKTAQVSVTVIPKVLDSISVKPIKVTYVDGESFSEDDIEVTAKYNNGTTATVTDYTVDVGTFTLTNAAVAETVTVMVTYAEKGVEKSATYDVTVNPCVAIVNGKHYADLNKAIENAKAGDTIEMPLPGEYDVDVDKDLTFKNTSGEDISMKINNEEVTIEANSSYEVEIKDEMDSTYFTFYLQMLQWRNRTFIVSYKQTEGGTISGANAARFSQSVTFTVTPDDGYAIADVLVNGKSVGAVDSYTIRSIKANTTVSATFEKLETEAVEIVPETAPWANPFTDVGEMDAFYVAVQYVYENGLFKGMSNTEFGPAITMNRAMFVTVLGRLTGVNVDDFTTVTFADCEAGSWYAPYVEWAAKAGIVKGMNATEFAPNAEITVEQALTILYRYMITMGYDLTGADALTAYADAASVSDWAAPAVQWAVANEIYEVADALAPQSAAARSLVATLLYNLSGMLAK